MSALTKKQIIADQILANLVEVSEGTLLSYAELTKGMHNYIKKNRLRKGDEELASLASAPSVPTLKFQAIWIACSACGAAIPGSATYCDKCGEKQ